MKRELRANALRQEPEIMPRYQAQVEIAKTSAIVD